MKNNIALYITIGLVLTFVVGCTSMTTSAGDIESTPVSLHVDSNAALARCIERRGAQHTRQINELRAATAPTEVQVSYRDSVALICAQDDRREADRQLRALTTSHEACVTLLGPNGIRPDATGTVRTEAASAPTVDPHLQALLLSFGDDEAICSGRAIGGGGMNGMNGVAQVGGVPMIAGGMGIMPGVFGLGGMTPVTRNIVLDARGMSSGMVAVVTITSVAARGTGNIAPMAPGTLSVNALSGETPVPVLLGYDYQVLVQCQANGLTLRSVTHTSEFTAPTSTNQMVQVNSICGRG